MSMAYLLIPSLVVVTSGLFIAMDVLRFLLRFPDMILSAGYFVFVVSVSASVPMMRLFKKYPPPTAIPFPLSVASFTKTLDELSSAMI